MHTSRYRSCDLLDCSSTVLLLKYYFSKAVAEEQVGSLKQRGGLHVVPGFAFPC